MRKAWTARLAAGVGVAIFCGAVVLAEDGAGDPLSLLERQTSSTRPAVLPPATRPAGLTASTRPAGDERAEAAIRQGLHFLDQWQSENGSWDRLENPDPSEIHGPDAIEFPQGAFFPHAGPSDYDGPVKDQAEKDEEEVADTCLSAGAEYMAVESGREPELSKKCLKAIDYVCGDIAMWGSSTIYIQKREMDPVHDDARAHLDVRFYDSTVDTFFALRFLAGVRDRITDKPRQERVDAAIRMLVKKIEANQDLHGTWRDELNPQSILRVDPLASKKQAVKAPPLHTPWGDVQSSIDETPQYDDHYPNIMTHLMAMNAVNFAVAHGVQVKVEVRYRSEAYLRSMMRLRTDWGKKTDGYLLPAIVAALYQADEACQRLLADARARAAAGGREVEETPIRVLETHALEIREELRNSVEQMEVVRVMPYGPTLDALPEVLKAVRLVSPGDAAALARRLKNDLLNRTSYGDGHFDADALDPTDIETKNHPERRGDNTFGTATVMRLLMEIEDAKVPEEKAE